MEVLLLHHGGDFFSFMMLTGSHLFLLFWYWYFFPWLVLLVVAMIVLITVDLHVPVVVDVVPEDRASQAQEDVGIEDLAFGTGASPGRHGYVLVVVDRNCRCPG